MAKKQALEERTKEALNKETQEEIDEALAEVKVEALKEAEKIEAQYPIQILHQFKKEYPHTYMQFPEDIREAVYMRFA